MANWNLPLTTSLYTVVLSELDGRLDDVALMFDGLAPTNLPVGAFRLHGASSNLLGKWNGATWDNQELSVQTLLVGIDGTNASATVTDIALAADANIASTGSLKLYIDSDNTTTDRVFGVYKNAAAVTGAVQLLSLGESGAMAVLGNVTAPTFVGALTGNASTATTAGTVTTAAQAAITSLGTLTGLVVTGTVTALANLTATATTSTALLAYSNVANRTVAVAEIINDNATGLGEALFMQQDQSGNGIRLLQNFVGTSQSAILANITNATNTGNVIEAQSSGTGPGFYCNAINAAGRSFSAYSNIASRTSPLVDIVNDNDTGTGTALRIQQDQGGPHIDLSGVNGTGITIGGVVQPIIPAQVTDHVRAGNMQLDNGSLGYVGFDIRAQVTASTWETVGPADHIARGVTAATNTWAAMDEMTANATVLIVGLVVTAVGNSATLQATVNVFFAEGNVTTPGSTVGTTERGHIAIDVNVNPSVVGYETMVFIPLATDNQDFQVSWEQFNCTAGSITAQIYYRGFLTD